MFPNTTEKTYNCKSNPSEYVINGKNSFKMSFPKPITMPGEDCVIQVLNSTLWYNTPNVIFDKNSKLFFNILGMDYTINIPSGLYNYANLKSMISVEISKLGLAIADSFELTVNNSIQKFGFIIGTNDVVFDFTQAATMREILGYNIATYSYAHGSLPISYFAPNVAKLNSVTEYHIHCDAIDQGLNSGAVATDILEVVLIPPKTSVGSQIIQVKPNPSTYRASKFINNKVDNITFRITDQDDKDIDTLGENWGCEIRLISKGVKLDYKEK